MRREGWERALAEAIEAARHRPFAWGVHDCATWAADVRRAMTGSDAAARWRGRYHTARGAARTIRLTGAASLVEAAGRELGSPLASPLLAQRGDIVSDGAALGVCTGAEAAFLSADGLAFRPLIDCTMAWRV